MWCQNNNPSLNVSKTKELIVDYRKRRAEQVPINIDGAEVERVESFKILGVHITNKPSWSKHTKTVVKRARQPFFSLRRQNVFGMGPQILKNSTAAPSRASRHLWICWGGMRIGVGPGFQG